MALSVVIQRNGPEWPLGAVIVATAGNTVPIMKLVDANNTNAPETASNSQTSEYTTTCQQILLQGYIPGNNNNGMVKTTGNVYLIGPYPANQGPGNRSDSGCILTVCPPGGSVAWPPTVGSSIRFSPYRYALDADVNGEGALVTLMGPQGQ